MISDELPKDTDLDLYGLVMDDEDDIETNKKLKDFVFDQSFMKKITKKDESYCEDEVVAFRATRGDEEIYIILFNCHNGYYGHGFDMKVGDLGIYEGSL